VQGTIERQHLDATSWIDIGRGWLSDPHDLYATLVDALPWHQNTIWAYDHHRPDPRLTAGCRPGRDSPHPAVTEIHKALRRYYGVELAGVGLSWYRDGRDAMGAHRDTDLRHCEETLIAIVSLGATRSWTLTPKGTRTPAMDVAPAAGDLLVMGGRAQADWLPNFSKEWRLTTLVRQGSRDHPMCCGRLAPAALLPRAERNPSGARDAS